MDLGKLREESLGLLGRYWGKIVQTDLEQLREEAADLLEDDRSKVLFRSCWNCNQAHYHLKAFIGVLVCLDCGRYYFKGVDVTEDESEEIGSED